MPSTFFILDPQRVLLHGAHRTSGCASSTLLACGHQATVSLRFKSCGCAVQPGLERRMLEFCRARGAWEAPTQLHILMPNIVATTRNMYDHQLNSLIPLSNMQSGPNRYETYTPVSCTCLGTVGLTTNGDCTIRDSH
uniref:Uncharacterized protein n=1 Tax=Eutreptiella gymnastica TaxID=73025 RepID=A0A6T2BEY8_9EUGL